MISRAPNYGNKAQHEINNMDILARETYARIIFIGSLAARLLLEEQIVMKKPLTKRLLAKTLNLLILVIGIAGLESAIAQAAHDDKITYS